MDNYNIEIGNAVPLCLIINEVITNSYKYAFVNLKSGEIKIKLCGKNHLIIIKDNGSGFDYNAMKDKSLGMSLIKDLSEQIDAKFEFKNNNGTEFSIYLNN